MLSPNEVLRLTYNNVAMLSVAKQTGCVHVMCLPNTDQITFVWSIRGWFSAECNRVEIVWLAHDAKKMKPLLFLCVRACVRACVFKFPTMSELDVIDQKRKHTPKHACVLDKKKKKKILYDSILHFPIVQSSASKEKRASFTAHAI